MARAFNTRQKEIIWDRDNGICGICYYVVRKSNWEADHIYPYSLGGPTDVDNGQVTPPGVIEPRTLIIELRMAKNYKQLKKAYPRSNTADYVRYRKWQCDLKKSGNSW